MENSSVEVTNEKLKMDDQLKLDQPMSVDMEQVNMKGKAGQSPTTYGYVDVVGGGLRVPVKKDCFGRFPEEIRLAVLDQLADSRDILSVLRAFPELDKPFQKKKAYWLFDQVVPHLMTKYLVAKKKVNDDFLMHTLESRALLKLRLVSKRWKHAVEMSLQSHPDRHPPLSTNTRDTDGDATFNTTVPFNHFSYQNMYKYHLGASIFHTPDQVNQFLEEMRNFQGNPFPGKSILVTPKEGYDFNTLLFAKNVVEMLEKFGQHVEVLDWNFGDNIDGHTETCQLILKGLSYIPNVQSITFSGELDDDDVDDNNLQGQVIDQPESQELFPSLPHLNTFNFSVNCLNPGGDSNRWLNRMKETYAGSNQTSRLRKLTIGHDHLDATLNRGLKHLTELHLLLRYFSNCTAASIENVLRMFPNDQIRKFIMGDYTRVVGDREIYINELVDVLVNFEFETVIFERFRLKEKPFKEGITILQNALSVTSLCFEDSSELNYEFLMRFPNLRNLSIYVNNDTYREFLIGGHPEEDTDSLGFKVREYYSVFDQDYEKLHGQFSIWEAVPKLEMLYVSVEVVKVADFSYESMDVQYLRSYGNKPFFGGRVPEWMENRPAVDME